MSANFDIFMRLPDGHPWIKAVETLDEARHLLRPLAMSFPEDYFKPFRARQLPPGDRSCSSSRFFRLICIRNYRSRR
jgi:hypothetical protein